MKIIFVTTKFDFETGGGSTPELDLKIRALRERGHKVRAVTVFSQNNRGIASLSYPLSQEYIGTNGQFQIQRGVYGILKRYENETDIFHVDGVVLLYGSALYRFFGGKIPVVAHLNREQSSFPESRRRGTATANLVTLLKQSKHRIRFYAEKIFTLFLVNTIDVFTFTSPLLQKLYNRFGLSEKRSKIIRDFVDERALIHFEKEESRFSSVTSPVVTIVCSGRMVWEKAFDILLRAFAKLPHKERFRLIVSGDGPEENNLQHLIRDLGIESYVTFPGWVPKEKLFDFLGEADIFVVPRWRPELASMLLFEAMAFGLPCIVPQGSTLAWSAGEAAVTFEDLNVDELTERILELADKPEKRKEQRLKDKVQLEKIDYRKVVMELEVVLMNLYTRNGRGIQVKKIQPSLAFADFFWACIAGEAMALLSIPVLKNLGGLTYFFKSHYSVSEGALLFFWVLFLPIATTLGLYLIHRFTIQRGRSLFELGKYGIVGFLNTFLNLGIFNFLVLMSGQAKGLIVDSFVVIAFVLTVTNSFFWNKFWIFEHQSNQARSEYARFFLVSAVIAFGNTLLIHWWINVLGAPAGWDLKLWANIIFFITIPISFLGNYFGYRLLVFKKK